MAQTNGRKPRTDRSAATQHASPPPDRIAGIPFEHWRAVTDHKGKPVTDPSGEAGTCVQVDGVWYRLITLPVTDRPAPISWPDDETMAESVRRSRHPRKLREQIEMLLSVAEACAMVEASHPTVNEVLTRKRDGGCESIMDELRRAVRETASLFGRVNPPRYTAIDAQQYVDDVTAWCDQLEAAARGAAGRNAPNGDGCANPESSASGVRKPRVPADVAEDRLRKLIKGTPEARLWPSRQVASEIGCSPSQVFKLDAWKAHKDERRRNRLPAAREESWEYLAREQAADEQRDRRRHRRVNDD